MHSKYVLVTLNVHSSVMRDRKGACTAVGIVLTYQ